MPDTPLAPPARSGALSRLAHVCAAHGWRTIVTWIVAVVAVVVLSQSFGGALVDEFSLPDSDSQRATGLLESRFPARSGDAAQMVFAVDSGRLDQGSARAAVESAVAAARQVPGVTEVADPLAAGSGELSDDGWIAYADVQFAQKAIDVDTGAVHRLEDGARAVAMSLPIALAIASVGIGTALITLAAGFWTFGTITPTLATMIGLGVGIDFITKMGLGAAITVAVAVVAAVTLLPGILGLLGHRIDKGRLPFMPHRDDSEAACERSLVARWGRWVTSRPWVTGGAALLVLIVLALPVLTVQLGSSDAGSNRAGSTTRKAYDLLAAGFGPGFNGPLIVAVDQTGDPGAAARVGGAIRGSDGVDSVADPAFNETTDTAVVTAFPRDLAAVRADRRARAPVATTSSPARFAAATPTPTWGAKPPRSRTSPRSSRGVSSSSSPW